VYPGFWSCVTVGTNHPVHEVHVFANVFASSIKYQVLETSAHLGDTIHAIDAALQIICPPSQYSPNPGSSAILKERLPSKKTEELQEETVAVSTVFLSTKLERLLITLFSNLW
jgi:hypothetical protein